MRVVLLAVSVLLLLAPTARGDEIIVLEDWTAQFERGVKIGWRHDVIVEHEGAAADAIRFVHTQRSWKRIGKELEHSETISSTDAKGRVLAYAMTVKGPAGPWVIKADAKTWSFKIRELAKAEGTFEGPVRDGDILRLLMRRGDRKPGDVTISAIDLPGRGSKEKSFSYARNESGVWQLDVKQYRSTHTDEGGLVEATDGGKPFWIRLPATESNAPDLRVRDGAARAGKAPETVDLATVRMRIPGPEWQVAKLDMSGMRNIGIGHPLEVGVFAAELPVAFPDADEVRLRIAASFRERMTGPDKDMELSDPKIVTFRGRPAVRMAIGGVIDGIPATGEWLLFANRDDHCVLMVAAYQKDLAAACEPLLEEAMKAFEIDGVPAPEVRWERVEAKPVGVTFELPETWIHVAERMWRSPKGGMVAVMVEGATEHKTGPERAKAWLEELRTNRVVTKVDVTSEADVEVDGTTMRRVFATVWITRGPDTEPMRQFAVVSAARQGKDGPIVMVVVGGQPGLATKPPAWIDRVLKSLRWKQPPAAEAPQGERK